MCSRCFLRFFCFNISQFNGCSRDCIMPQMEAARFQCNSCFPEDVSNFLGGHKCADSTIHEEMAHQITPCQNYTDIRSTQQEKGSGHGAPLLHLSYIVDSGQAPEECFIPYFVYHLLTSSYIHVKVTGESRGKCYS